MRVGAAPLGICVGFVVSACFIKPDPPATNDSGTGGDAATDGMSTTSDAAACTLADEFETNGTGCGNAGNAEGSGSQTVQRINGALEMAGSSSATFSACQSLYVPWDQVVVQIAQYVTTSSSRTGVTLSFDAAETFTVELDSSGAATARLNNGSPNSLFMASGPTYFRFRESGAALLLDWATTATSWGTATAFSLAAPRSNVAVRLYTFYGNGGNARFDHLDACPP